MQSTECRFTKSFCPLLKMDVRAFLLVVAAALLSLAWGVSYGSEKIVVQSKTGKGKLGLYGFSFQDCGGPSAVLHGSVSVSPNNPIVLPGDLTVSFDADFGVDLKSPLKTVIVLKKKELIWLTLPCIDGLGSCTYDDFCSKLPPVPPAGCPPPLKAKGIPCSCPVKAGKYSLPPSVFNIPNIQVPEFLADGEYQANITMFYGTKELGCAFLEFKLQINE
ncbi:ganglioside GM2 activator-like [Patiria miniata]|uniref:MD-2-related lipid-recognition domain-containing protein n=1 Tax=Patiria miniata TaxID=46514 RepID=A0A913ZZT1_PATMI|nr:ganglioside GM2 activator-like [Patiria miniata]